MKQQVDTVKLEDKRSKVKDDVLGTMLRIKTVLGCFVSRVRYDRHFLHHENDNGWIINFNVYGAR